MKSLLFISLWSCCYYYNVCLIMINRMDGIMMVDSFKAIIINRHHGQQRQQPHDGNIRTRKMMNICHSYLSLSVTEFTSTKQRRMSQSMELYSTTIEETAKENSVISTDHDDDDMMIESKLLSLTNNKLNNNMNNKQNSKIIQIVLVAGFESFNRELYEKAANELKDSIHIQVFSDSEIRLSKTIQQQLQHEHDNEVSTSNTNEVIGIMKSKTTTTSIGLNDDGIDSTINPIFQQAVLDCDVFIGSLIFDYDDVMAVQKTIQLANDQNDNNKRIRNIGGKHKLRFIFECATELMQYNEVNTFNMMSSDSSPAGPPPAIKAILSKFNSGKEEDKLNSYIKLLKFGPELLSLLPGNKFRDIKTWLQIYRYWNQGGSQNIISMLQLIYNTMIVNSNSNTNSLTGTSTTTVVDNTPPVMLIPKDVEITPDVGLIHPLHDKEIQQHHQQQHGTTSSMDRFFSSSPSIYMKWRLSSKTYEIAKQLNYQLAPIKNSPIVTILLYRKHVVTNLLYISQLITIMEKQGIIPVPIFINGVEAHTIVRDLLTSTYEIQQVQNNHIKRDTTYQTNKAISVDAIVNTIGFPLVGGPAGSMETGRNIAIAEQLLSNMNIPYIIACPLLLQSITQWQKSGVLGLQSVVLYSLPELDGAIDTVVLGGLVGDKIALIPERVRKLTNRIKSWYTLRTKSNYDKKVAISVYGFPPNVGATGTAALLDVPHSLEQLLFRLHKEGYNVGDWGSSSSSSSSGESLIAALSVLCENPVIARGAESMQELLDNKIQRAVDGDVTVAETLSKPNGGLGGATVHAVNISPIELKQLLGKYMMKQVSNVWYNNGNQNDISNRKNSNSPGLSRTGDCVVSGLQIGNIFLFVQPLLGIEGDPMRLLFEKDLTPHPQYCATYKYISKQYQADAIIHLGMHGTVEWLPGQALGNDRKSWSDDLLDNLPNIYVYAANNPSESILAKRRGYGTLVSYNVPPYGRSGLYLELANLKDLVEEYRSNKIENDDLKQTIYDLSQRSGMVKDVPLVSERKDGTSPTAETELSVANIDNEIFDKWILKLSDYLAVLQDRLFSSGLRVLGSKPQTSELDSYLEAYFGDRLSEEHRRKIISDFQYSTDKKDDVISSFFTFVQNLLRAPDNSEVEKKSELESTLDEAMLITKLLDQSTEEMDSLIVGLDGGYIKPKPGGDLLRDGPSVLPTGRNIHALDPYRMPSATAWARGQRAAEEIIRQHRLSDNDKYPETIAVTLWGLDAIKTRGESVAIVLALVGAKPVKEGTGRIVRYDLVPLEELRRPRVDVLASLSGIFRDSFGNVVDLLDDMFERAARADEPVNMNFIKKHSDELLNSGVKERTAARLFSNPPGDYGSMVNEVVGTGDWEDTESLGETWRGRNVFSYGRNEGNVESKGTSRPQVLDKLLATTERVVQEIDSVEYGLTDIQEYYANTGALKKAAENRKEIDPSTGKKKKVVISVIEAFGGGTSDNDPIPVKDVEQVLRLEYRSKLLNPKWRDAMLRQGSGGAYEISQRMTAMVGWSATTEVDNFVFDQAAERYALDEDVARQLQKSNPEAFKNVLRRLLEANGRGMWDTDSKTLDKLRDMYSDADDMVEQGTSTSQKAAMATKR